MLPHHPQERMHMRREMSMLDNGRDRRTLADLTVAIYDVGSTTVVELSGEFDTYTAQALRRHLDCYASTRFARVVVDLRALRFIDSAGIAVLVALGKQAAAQSGALRLVLHENHLLVKLQRMGLLKLWPIHAELGMALAAQSAPPGGAAPDQLHDDRHEGDNEQDHQQAEGAAVTPDERRHAVGAAVEPAVGGTATALTVHRHSLR
jgi:anti-sigma B factor antagonist